MARVNKPPATSSLPVGLRTLAIVQAGGRGSRMGVLTRLRAKPALPFAGAFALVDFPLSCLAASVVDDVWVGVQYLPSSLDQHLSGGRPWDLDRTVGGFRRLVPAEGSGDAHEDGFSHGNADNLFRIRREIEDFGADVLVVMSADHIFALELDEVIAAHVASGAECTLVTAEVGVQEAAHKMVVHARADGTVTSVEEKPGTTSCGVVATEIFLYRPDVLVTVLEELHQRLEDDPDDPDTELGDFGDHLVPELVRRGATRAWRLEGYWRDVGRVQAYLQAHRDLLAGRVDAFQHPRYAVRGSTQVGPPALVTESGALESAMAGPGAVVRGRVVRSVLGPGVEVQAGAEVVDSVVLEHVLVESGARVHTAIVDAHARIGRGAVVGAQPAGTRLSDEAVAVVGREAVVGAGACVAPGGRVEPRTRTT